MISVFCTKNPLDLFHLYGNTKMIRQIIYAQKKYPVYTEHLVKQILPQAGVEPARVSLPTGF